jgi:hypothetical protein
MSVFVANAISLVEFPMFRHFLSFQIGNYIACIVQMQGFSAQKRKRLRIGKRFMIDHRHRKG